MVKPKNCTVVDFCYITPVLMQHSRTCIVSCHFLRRSSEPYGVREKVLRHKTKYNQINCAVIPTSYKPTLTKLSHPAVGE